MEVLVVGNTAYVDDDFCAKAFPGDHVQVVAAAEARRDESSPHASWKELLQHLDQAHAHHLGDSSHIGAILQPLPTMRGTPASWVFVYEGTVPCGCTAPRRGLGCKGRRA